MSAYHHPTANPEEVTVRLTPAQLESGVHPTEARLYDVSADEPSDMAKLIRMINSYGAAVGTATTAATSQWGAGPLLGITGLAVASQELVFRLTTAAGSSQSNTGAVWLNRGSQAAIIGGVMTFVGGVALGAAGETSAALTLIPCSAVLTHSGVTAQLLIEDNDEIKLRLVDAEEAFTAGSSAGKAKRD